MSADESGHKNHLHVSHIDSQRNDHEPVKPLVHKEIFEIYRVELTVLAEYYAEQFCDLTNWSALSSQCAWSDRHQVSHINERLRMIRKFLGDERFLSTTSRINLKWADRIAESKRLRQEYGPIEAWPPELFKPTAGKV